MTTLKIYYLELCNEKPTNLGKHVYRHLRKRYLAVEAKNIENIQFNIVDSCTEEEIRNNLKSVLKCCDDYSLTYSGNIHIRFMNKDKYPVKFITEWIIKADND